MFERFTDRARRSVVLAQEEARRLRHNYIGTEHLLLGLVREGDGVAAIALASLDISLETVRERVEQTIGPSRSPLLQHIPFTPRAKEVLELALREALELGHDHIGTEHILLGLVREGEGVASQVLVALGADLDRVREAVIGMLRGYSAELEMAAPSPRPFEVPRRVPPLCPNCSEVLSNTLAVRVVETAGEDEPIAVKIAYCSRCGVALGTVS